MKAASRGSSKESPKPHKEPCKTNSIATSSKDLAVASCSVASIQTLDIPVVHQECFWGVMRPGLSFQLVTKYRIPNIGG